MGWVRDNLLSVSVVVFLVATSLLTVVGYAGLVTYSALRTGTPIVGVLLDLAVPYLLLVAGLVVICVLSGLGLAVGTVDRVSGTSLPRSARLQSALEAVERTVPALSPLGLSRAVGPPDPSAEEQAERALAALKQQYVAGRIDEQEFERKLDRLVTNESIDDVRAARERERTLER